MKRLFTILAAVLLTATMWAQSPQKMSYQAVIRDGFGELVQSHAIGMQISILKDENPVYVETHSAGTNENGLVTIEIGGGTFVSGVVFSAIDWSDGTYFIKTETDPTGGTNYAAIVGTSQILSVPYALHAKTAASYTETDPEFTAWDKSTGISIPASQVSDFQTSVTNNADVLASTAKNSYPTSDATKVANLSGINTGDNAVNILYNGLVTNATHTGDATGSEALTLATVNSDVGTFNNITINAKGLATAGSYVSYLTSEADPIWTTASVNYYTKTNMQTSGASQLHFNNLTNTPTTVAGFGITDAVITTGNQTIAGNKTFSGTTTVAPPVNANDAANKAYVDGLIEQLYAQGVLKLKDYDGNYYNTIKIGNQIWMAENLKTTYYNDGTAIPNITDNTAWAALITGAYCDYNNTPANSTTYGRLYNWYAVDNNALTKVASNGGKNVCPTGWHVPSDTEWTTLTDYLTNNGYGYGGSGSDIAKSMAATSGWTTDPTAGNVGNDQASNNSSGFTALPGGTRYGSGTYFYDGSYGYWWSSMENSETDAWLWNMGYDYTDVYSYDGSKQVGFSVRCIKE